MIGTEPGAAGALGSGFFFSMPIWQKNKKQKGKRQKPAYMNYQ
jgi:hypothetical protein